jgi:DNA-binding NarL/FixJ family response regulator
MSPPVPPLRVLVVDDATDYGYWLQRILARQDDMECVGVLDCADDLITHALRTLPDVILLDLHMPGADPLEIIPTVLERCPCRVLAMSGRDDDATVKAVLRAGAAGFVCKDAEATGFVDLLRQIAVAPWVGSADCRKG